MVREIVFDTETTGFKPEDGERLVEIGAIELINHLPTGREYHQYINPCKEVPEEAFKVHGLSYEFLKDYPVFEEVADKFLEFIGEDAKLIAHNAAFDINFLNYELKAINRSTLEWDRVIDTLEIARNKFPGARASLDALCRRFEIDASDRTKHGALIDSELLAKVYLELIGGVEPTMLQDNKNSGTKTQFVENMSGKSFRVARNFNLSAEELEAHKAFLQKKIKLEEVW
ncbi:MAG: DNA polymerase III subunit epsilon [Alphaproteobacteria bacterium]|nr:DNA polymerase III subunit epsilon [Alphaproteobacteria bacterium]